MKPSQLRARYWRIVFFFARVTASFIWWEIFLPRVGLGGWSSRTRSERYQRIAVRFRALAIRMGGLMIKVGQFLSARLDVLPIEITQELVRPARRSPRRGLRRHPSSRPRPSSASHSPSATTGSTRRRWPPRRSARCTGRGCVTTEAELHGFEDVVIKVQRPHIEQVVEVDLAALRRVGGWLQRYKPVSKRADVRALVEEFAATTREEIDYVAEAHNAETFAAAFEDNPRIHIPQVVWEPQHPPRADARERRGDQDRRLRGDHRRRHRPLGGRLGGARRLHADDSRGRLLPRRPAPRQPLRHPARGHR